MSQSIVKDNKVVESTVESKVNNFKEKVLPVIIKTSIALLVGYLIGALIYLSKGSGEIGPTGEGGAKQEPIPGLGSGQDAINEGELKAPAEGNKEVLTQPKVTNDEEQKTAIGQN